MRRGATTTGRDRRGHDVVCDWSGADAARPRAGALRMPKCAKGTCSGHRATDVLPFGLGDDGKTYYTNEEFYTYMSPTNEDLAYVYDSLSSWPACEDQGISFWAPPGEGLDN